MFANFEQVTIKVHKQTAPSCKVISLQQQFTGKEGLALFAFYTYKTAQST
jgi:hypothetical protein